MVWLSATDLKTKTKSKNPISRRGKKPKKPKQTVKSKQFNSYTAALNVFQAEIITVTQTKGKSPYF